MCEASNIFSRSSPRVLVHCCSNMSAAICLCPVTSVGDMVVKRVSERIGAKYKTLDSKVGYTWADGSKTEQQ